MALQDAMGSMGGGAPAPAPGPMAPAPEAAPGGDVASAASQAMELLSPFADQPGISEALALLEGALGGPGAGVAEDPMMEEVEGGQLPF